MDTGIIEDELGLLGRVGTLLQEVPYVAPPREEQIVRELVRLRDEIPSSKEEDKGALLMQYNQQIALLDQLRAARDHDDVDPDSPYFAHLRVSEGGVVRDLCIGKATRVERGVRIVDWRNAPISKIFYRYQQDEEYEEVFGGRTVEGTVIARRTVTILRQELLRVECPEGVYSRGEVGWEHRKLETARLAGGEGISMHAYQAGEGVHRRMGTDLAGHRRRQDKRLPDIAGLIDAEQFELITKPTSGFVVIRGTAGSGKTTVALHRIAWMAYEDPAINSDRTMFMVFSRALRDFVGHVLPALGVERVSVQTFQGWASQLRQRHFPHLPRAVREDTPSWASRFKLHPAMLTALERQVRNVTAPATPEQAVDDWVSVLTNPDELFDAYEEVSPGMVSLAEVERFTQWCRDRATEVVAWMEGDRKVDAALDMEDEALLLRAWQLRVGPLRGSKKQPLVYRHIALDEVQDFSPVEVRVLLACTDHRQSITLAGDTQQHVMQDAGFTSWTQFFGHLGVEGLHVNTLRVAYRSSAEIVDFAIKLLGDLREDEPPMTTRSGPPVELFRFTDDGAAVSFLADALRELVRAEPMASIALLTPNRQVSARYFSGLQHGEVPRLRRVVDQDFSFAPGVEITEIAQVKGLEFDYVILVEVSAHAYPDTPSSRRLLHVGATRAVHQLWLTSVADPSSILHEAIDTRR